MRTNASPGLETGENEQTKLNHPFVGLKVYKRFGVPEPTHRVTRRKLRGEGALNHESTHTL